MKYIHHRHLGLILFEPGRQHGDIAALIRAKPEDIQGAGFVGAVKPDECFCFGESRRLGIAARDEDSLKLRCMLKAAMSVCGNEISQVKKS
jgi:hypothetical protein